MNGEHKITSFHRERAALIYLRQSSMAQVREHTESTRSQYGLADTAAALGWARTSIEVIDTDLGISGKWGVAREGFTELVTRVCSGDVGAIFGIEITRLARSNALGTAGHHRPAAHPRLQGARRLLVRCTRLLLGPGLAPRTSRVWPLPRASPVGGSPRLPGPA